MLRRMIVPAGLAAVLGLLASAALADGEKRTTVQDENRVEPFDRLLEPPRREAGARREAIGGYRPSRIMVPTGGIPIAPPVDGGATTACVRAAICSSPALRMGFPAS